MTAASPAAVWAAGTLTLDDCIRLALEARSSATVARRQVQIAHYGFKQTRAAFLPQSRIGSGFVI